MARPGASLQAMERQDMVGHDMETQDKARFSRWIEDPKNLDLALKILLGYVLSLGLSLILLIMLVNV